MYGSHGMHSITTFAMEPGEMAQQRVHAALARTGVYFSAPSLTTCNSRSQAFLCLWPLRASTLMGTYPQDT